jgi:hypothetical protein
MPIPNRPLRLEERELVRAMLRGKPNETELLSSLDCCLVEDMEDGGMGSVRFVSRSQRRRALGDAVAEAEYTDEDGVLVHIVINTDDDGELYELDSWKVDFAPLRRYPGPSDIRMKG